MTNTDIAQIARDLTDLEREWIVEWQGVAGAAFNVIAVGLQKKGLLRGITDWRLNETGLEVRKWIMENSDG